jgi:DNA-binding SARP family transcriptional activator
VEELAQRGVSFYRGFGQYQLRLPSDVWVDTEAATSALDRAEAVLRSKAAGAEGDAGRALGPATVAASITRRPFLPGVDGFWRESQRGKLERQLVRALDCLAEMQLVKDEPEAAVETALEASLLDPYRERTRRCLMQAYAATGNRAKALSAYHELRGLLSGELGTEPETATQALYLKLLD